MTNTEQSHAADTGKYPVHALLRDLPHWTNKRFRHAEVPVSEHAIRVWCNAIGDANPVYRDASAARAVGLPGVVAPNAMLQTWTMPITSAESEASPSLHSSVRTAARAAGFGHVVATDYEQDYHRPVQPSDLLVEHSWIDEISDVKDTSLGYGVFVTIGIDITTAAAEPVGTMRSRTFYFNPLKRPVDRSGRSRSAAAAAGAASHGSVALGPMEVELDRQLIIAGALASNDHELVHFDHLSAKEQGLSDIIASIVTTTGLMLRYAGERLPSNIWYRSLRLNLSRPAFPGDTLRFSGSRRSLGGRTDLTVVAQHARGVHATASLDLGLVPDSA